MCASLDESDDENQSGKDLVLESNQRPPGKPGVLPTELTRKVAKEPSPAHRHHGMKIRDGEDQATKVLLSNQRGSNSRLRTTISGVECDAENQAGNVSKPAEAGCPTNGRHLQWG